MKDIVNCAKKYCELLLNEDFSEFCGFSVSKRRHVLAAFANLSRFLGRYEDFKRLLKEYGLKWESTKVEDLLISRLSKAESDVSVLEWAKTVRERFPRFAVFIEFVTVSGLRLVEALDSYNLIIDLNQKGRLTEYYKAEKESLEHFRFKEIFIRNNKKAFLSFVPRELIEKVSTQKEKFTASLIYDCIKRQGVKPRFNDLREYYATFMTRFLSQSEIDFLQGRVSGSVFMRNYFNPALISDLKERVFNGIADIEAHL